MTYWKIMSSKLAVSSVWDRVSLKPTIYFWNTISTPRIRKRESISVNGPFPYKGLFIANDAKSEWAWDAIRGFGYRQSVSMNDLLEDNVIKAGGFLSMGQGFFKTYDLFLEYNLNK